MKDLNDTLRAKEEQLKRIQKEIDSLRHTLQILASEDAKPRLKKGTGKAARVALLPGTVITQPLMVRSVLLDKGTPLHVDAIAEDIKKKFGAKLKPQYLTSIIYRTMKKGKLFRREGSNTFGLLEWPSVHQDLNPQNALRLQ